VVVDDVDEHAEAPGVARVDQGLQPVGPAVGVVRRPQVDPVVAPAPAAGELDDRHELDGVDAQLDQVVEVVDGTGEGPGGREGADVQLVEHRVLERAPPPRRVGPGERRGVDELGRAVHVVGLAA
jgi:hypothetical protein